MNEINALFTKEALDRLFPIEKTGQFFEALFGDDEEGAYDIRLNFKGIQNKRLEFEFHLIQRAGKCLACNLTYGLPTVFERHPVINIEGLIKNIGHLLTGRYTCKGYKLGKTEEISRKLHIIPLTVSIESQTGTDSSGIIQ